MGELLSRSSPTPLQELADKGLNKINHCKQIDSRREPRFAFAVASGQGPLTLSAKKVDFQDSNTVSMFGYSL